MPKGEDSIRSRYFDEGKTHPNRRKVVRTGYAENNYPSTRTFYSDISTDVVRIAKKLSFYVSLLKVRDVHFLEKVSHTIGYPVSNYTICGLLNMKWGVRHNPTAKTKISIGKLTRWLEHQAKQLGVWQPFRFSYHPDQLSGQTQTEATTTKQQQPYENKKQSFWKASYQNREKERQGRHFARINFWRNAPLSKKPFKGDRDKIKRLPRCCWRKAKDGREHLA